MVKINKSVCISVFGYIAFPLRSPKFHIERGISEGNVKAAPTANWQPSVEQDSSSMEEYPTKQATENLDDPPNSRLFAVTSRSITEDELRESFSVFGDIQGVWVVKDKQTKESKGISYIKFAKSSQACLAMEEMHGKVLMEGTKPIKVTLTAQAHTINAICR